MKFDTILIVLLFSLTVCGFFSLHAGDTKKKYAGFDEVRKDVLTHYQQKKYAEAIALYESVKDRYPDKAAVISMDLVMLYLKTGDHEKCMDILQYGQEHKVTYPIWPGAGLFAPMEKFDRFKKIAETNTRLQAEATAKNKAAVEVVTPEGYSADKKYPLIVILHGWNMNADVMKQVWKSGRTDKEFIQAYVNSSQVVADGKYGWTDLKLGQKDVAKMYAEVLETYAVDPGKVIIAGFSQGGRMTIDIALNKTIPVIGFVALKPGGGIPDSLNPENVKKAAAGLRGAIITGEKDHGLEDQQKMVKILETAGFPHRFVVQKDQGHWFTSGFGAQLEEAVAYILKEKIGK